MYEAKRLMLTESKDASSASLAVGYESPTQFNREYKRLFGRTAAQGRDEDALRTAALAHLPRAFPRSVGVRWDHSKNRKKAPSEHIGRGFFPGTAFAAPLSLTQRMYRVGCGIGIPFRQ